MESQESKRKELVVLNSISPNMIPEGGIIEIDRISVEEARELVNSASEVKSFIGHPGTASIVSELFGRQIPANRSEFKAQEPADALIVNIGVRLQEGQVLNKDDVMRMYEDGKVLLFRGRIIPIPKEK